MDRSDRSSLSHRRPAARFALGAALVAAALAAGLAAAPPVRALDEVPDSRLGLSAMSGSSGGLLGFLDRDRLTHSRSLSFGYASSSGGPGRQMGAAAYTDFFAYRLRDNLLLDLALQYNFSSNFRSATEERGEFSVLPSFALEYHPGRNSLLRLSYERFGPGSSLLSGRRIYPY